MTQKTVVLEPTEDTYVKDSVPDVNYDTEINQWLGNYNSIRYIPYMKFNLPDDFSYDGLVSVSLSIFVNNVWGNTNKRITFHGIDPSLWDESTLTWNNQPSEDNYKAVGHQDNDINAAQRCVLLDTIPFETLPNMFFGDTASFCIQLVEDNIFSFNSREGSTGLRPELTLVYEPVYKQSFIVRDETGGIEGAYVNVSWYGSSSEGYTDANGAVSLEVNPSYYLTAYASKADYECYNTYCDRCVSDKCYRDSFVHDPAVSITLGLKEKEIACDTATPNFDTGCDLLIYFDADHDGVIIPTERDNAWEAEGFGYITCKEAQFVEDAYDAGSINALCTGCFVAPSLVISPTTHSSPAAGDTFAITVTSNIEWTVVNVDIRSWISFTPTSESGDGTITVTVAANLLAERTGTIRVTGSGITRTCAITQASGLPTLCSQQFSLRDKDTLLYIPDATVEVGGVACEELVGTERYQIDNLTVGSFYKAIASKEGYECPDTLCEKDFTADPTNPAYNLYLKEIPTVENYDIVCRVGSCLWGFEWIIANFVSKILPEAVSVFNKLGITDLVVCPTESYYDTTNKEIIINVDLPTGSGVPEWIFTLIGAALLPFFPLLGIFLLAMPFFRKTKPTTVVPIKTIISFKDEYNRQIEDKIGLKLSTGDDILYNNPSVEEYSIDFELVEGTRFNIEEIISDIWEGDALGDWHKRTLIAGGTYEFMLYHKSTDLADITVTVIDDETEEPIENATVCLHEPIADVLIYEETNADGIAVFTQVDKKIYSVSAYIGTEDFKIKSDIESLDATVTTEITLRLVTAIMFTARVFKEGTRIGIGDVEVKLVEVATGESKASDKTNKAGSVTLHIKYEDAGTYRVELLKTNYNNDQWFISEPFELVSHDSKEYELKLTATVSTVTIAPIDKDYPERRFPGIAHVTLEGYEQKTTNTDGLVTYNEVPHGDYNITVLVTDYTQIGENPYTVDEESEFFEIKMESGIGPLEYSLELDVIPDPLYVGDSYTFKGQLKLDSKPVSLALIQILDAEFFGLYETHIVEGETDADGKFNIPWIVEDIEAVGKADIYAYHPASGAESGIQKLAIKKKGGIPMMMIVYGVATAGLFIAGAFVPKVGKVVQVLAIIPGVGFIYEGGKYVSDKIPFMSTELEQLALPPKLTETLRKKLLS